VLNNAQSAHARGLISVTSDASRASPMYPVEARRTTTQIDMVRDTRERTERRVGTLSDR